MLFFDAIIKKNDIQCNFGIENRTLSKAKSDAERLNYLTHKHECTSLEPFVSRKPVERSPIPSAGSSKNYQDYAKTVSQMTTLELATAALIAKRNLPIDIFEDEYYRNALKIAIELGQENKSHLPSAILDSNLKKTTTGRMNLIALSKVVKEMWLKEFRHGIAGVTFDAGKIGPTPYLTASITDTTIDAKPLVFMNIKNFTGTTEGFENAIQRIKEKQYLTNWCCC